MRSDLDRLMAEHEIDAFFIPETEGENVYRDYLTGGVHASPFILKKRGEAPILMVFGMEREEAAKSGLAVLTFEEIGRMELIGQYGRGTNAELTAFYQLLVERFDINGGVTLYGTANIQYTMRLMEIFQALQGKIQIIRDKAPDIFDVAAETKDASELEKMREVGKRTGAVMQMTRDWISTHRGENGQVVTAEGKPLTIGDVKRFLRLKLLEQGLEDGGVTIFAQGRDAGIPHSRGEENEILRPGESIVFDLFPRTIGGGYYHDMTRTWSLGFAREDVQQAYEQVLSVFHRSLEGIEIGQPTNQVDKEVCRLFEAAGHPTKMSTPKTHEGYVHSLGHGLGLRVHEAPAISQFAADSTVFKAGHVVTIEPGLYYPSKGYGVRIEDTVYLDENGQLINLTDCPYDLVVPLRG
ncbi:MAG: aminopeptidase P family protein [Anaerolineae bacterium]|nr:MAG: aminopeptidase P family protein [Anaerolineae bacterium]